DVRETDSERRSAAVRAREPDTVVLHLEYELVSFDPRSNGEMQRVALSIETMPNGILDERLKNEARHQEIGGAFGNVEVDDQSVLETDPLDAEVPVEKIQLGTKRHIEHRRR